MVKKIAIDWDESELRVVVGQGSGAGVKVSGADVIALPEGASVSETLKKYVVEHELQKTETLVAIGRGKAELRELQLPPVPDDELPEMVRFQAIRSFASASDRAIVDYLVTDRSSENIQMIAAAVGPTQLNEIQETCQASDLTPKRIALRPLAAAALYLSTKRSEGNVVLIDLLSLDAEIVVAQDGKVIFVRTVRLPADDALRAKGLAGELRRSLLACGVADAPDEIVLWGRKEIHQGEADEISNAVEGARVSVVDPFDLVTVGSKAAKSLPQHVGRLAPLVGLLASDDVASDRLIDFLNPRKREEPKPNHLRTVLLVGGPIAALLLMGFFAYRRIAGLNDRIATLKAENAELQDPVDIADQQIKDTERVDLFLDSGVNWLDELQRIAEKMPPSEKLIVRTLSLSSSAKSKGGTVTITGGVTDSSVVDEFEEAVRDENHSVVNDGTFQDEKAKDRYRWNFDESISVTGDYVRNTRYERMLALEAAQQKGEGTANGAPETDVAPDPPSETDSTEDVELKSKPESPGEEKENPFESPEKDPPDGELQEILKTPSKDSNPFDDKEVSA